LTGVFPFGARLKIGELATRYETSHMPIREALRLLNGEGLVHIEPNKGVRVRSIDRDLIENMFDVRIVIEEMQARRAALRRNPAQLKKLQDARIDLENNANLKQRNSLLKDNHRFHSTISEAAGNLEAAKIEHHHYQLLRTLWGQFGYPDSRIPIVIDDHRRIVSAIEAQDADGAAILAKAHCYKARSDMLNSLDNDHLIPDTV